MKTHLGIHVRIVAILIALGGILQGLRAQSAEQQHLCQSGNEIRKSLVDTLDQLRPASLIRKPQETDEQYAFRQKQTKAGYDLLHQRLAHRKC